MMYTYLLTTHSLLRWAVVFSLCFAIIHAFIGFNKKRPFNRRDNAIRHWTATIAHIQLIVGMTLFIKSPVVKHFWSNLSLARDNFDALFYGFIHIFLMLTAIVFITIGSALAKRKQMDSEKFKTIFIWYFIGILIIFIAIPWPFSPLSNRPYFR